LHSQKQNRPFFCDESPRRLRVFYWHGCAAVSGEDRCVAGGGTAEKDAPALECKLREPFAVEFSPAGEMLIAEMTGGNRVLRADGKGCGHVLAERARKGSRAMAGQRLRRRSMASTTSWCWRMAILLLADAFNHAIRKIEAKSGIVTTIAGDGKKASAEMADRGAAQFDTPIQIALDPCGNNSSLQTSAISGCVESIWRL
jgi:hypothetical protein